MQFLARFLATGCFTGYFPIAPGTVGSVVAFFPYLLFPDFRGPILLAASILVFLIGVWAATQTEKITNLHDPSIVNLDEVVGQWIALLFLPDPVRWPVWIGAFLLFRLLDIVKPFPANQSQNLPGGWGVMIDDVIAGIYANIVLQLVLRIIF
jgi:phosphatidylglycerophosphatase A